MTLQDKLKQYIQTHQMIAAGTTTLLAVSGGADSMVMADLFVKIGYAIAVAHCNFGLRGAEADGDEALVRQWCIDNGITCHTVKFATKQQAQEWKKGTQETARILRYEWFDQLRKEYGYSQTATAHHANDNVETVLMNLFKGTGISGLHGIRPSYNNLIRPLLCATRQEIETYAEANGIPYRNDSSNASDDYLRNAIRLNIMPVVEQHVPGAAANINESIHRFGEAEILYKKAIDSERKKLIEQRGNDYYIPLRKLKQRVPLQTTCYELMHPFGFSSAQVPEIVKLMDAESGHYLSSATHRIIRNRDFFIVTTLPAQRADNVVIDTLPCTVETASGTFTFAIQDRPKQIETDSNTAVMDMQQVTLPLLLRKWKTGDYMHPLGMGMKKKKVGRLLINEKVPLHEKENVWVVEHEKRITWVAGYRLDERYKVKDATTQVLVIKKKL